MDYNKPPESTRLGKQARYTISEYDKRPGLSPAFPHKAPRLTMDGNLRRHPPPSPVPPPTQQYQESSQQTQTTHTYQQPSSQPLHSSQQHETSSQNRRNTMGSKFPKAIVSRPHFKQWKNGNGLLGSTTKVRDTRDFRTVEFQRHAMKVIVEYLNQCNYGPIINKTLRGLTAKEFENIFKFLFKRYTPNHEFGPKFEDEFYDLLRILRYPSADSISPKSLYSIAAPHTLPRYLALLSWMVELCLSIDAGRNTIQERKKQEGIIGTAKGMSSAQMELLFVDYSKTKYREFLHGNGNQDVHDELEAVFKVIRKSNMDRHNNVLAEKEINLQEELYLTEQMKARNQARQKMKVIEERIALYNADTITKQQKIDKHMSANQKIEEDTAFLNREWEQLKTEKEKLMATIKNPEVTDKQIKKMEKQQSDLDMDVDYRRQLLDELRQNTWELETQVQRKRNDIERLLASYEELSNLIDHLPLNDIDIDISHLNEPLIFNPNTTDLDNMITPNIETKIIPTLQHRLDTLKETLSTIQSHKSQLHSEYQGKQEQLHHEQQERKKLENDCTKGMQQLTMERKEIKDEIYNYTDSKEQFSRASDKLKREALVECVQARSEQKITQLELASSKLTITELKSKLEKKLDKIVSEIDSISSDISPRIDETTKEFDQLFPLDLDLDTGA